MSDETQVIPGQQSLDDVAPVSRAQIDDALRGAPVNGDGDKAAKPARGPGGQFAKKGADLTTPVRQSAAADERDRADEARLGELADELNAEAADEPCEDCPPPMGEGMSRGLGVVVLAAGATLLYIGFDLISRGAVSRRLGGGARWDDDQ